MGEGMNTFLIGLTIGVVLYIITMTVFNAITSAQLPLPFIFLIGMACGAIGNVIAKNLVV